MKTLGFTFKNISEIEFTVNKHRVVKDTNGNWVATPPITSTQLQLAVNNYIQAIENN